MSGQAAIGIDFAEAQLNSQCITLHHAKKLTKTCISHQTLMAELRHLDAFQIYVGQCLLSTCFRDNMLISTNATCHALQTEAFCDWRSWIYMKVYCKQQSLNIDWHCYVGSVMVCLFCLHITQEVKAMRDMDQKQL